MGYLHVSIGNGVMAGLSTSPEPILRGSTNFDNQLCEKSAGLTEEKNPAGRNNGPSAYVKCTQTSQLQRIIVTRDSRESIGYLNSRTRIRRK